MKLQLDVAARWFYPPMMPTSYRPNRTSNWEWRCDQTRLWVDEPLPGGNVTIHLPPTLFTYSPADLVRMEVYNKGSDGLVMNLHHNGYLYLHQIAFPITRLWSEAKFTPNLIGLDTPNRIWSFRWRTLNAPNDILSRVCDTLDTAETLEDARNTIRREIALYTLNIPNAGRGI